MNARTWAGLASLDLVRQMYLYHLAVDPVKAKEIYRVHSDRVIRLMEKPVRRGWAELPQTHKDWGSLKEIVASASAAFARVEQSGARDVSYRKIYVSGDIMTKGNDFANGGVYNFLAERQIRIVPEPVCDFIEFIARAQPHLLYGRGANKAATMIYKANMVLIRNELYGLARQEHPWLPAPDVEATIRKTSEVLDAATNGGAALAVGSVLRHWEDYD